MATFQTGTKAVSEPEVFERAIAAFQGARNIVVLTGAGISVESGIPDFRSADGLWRKFEPFEYATGQAFAANPLKCWDLFVELGDTIRAAKPNDAHLALAKWESMLDQMTVITQNIDGLHQQAGSTRVIEFHGDVRVWVCLNCGKRKPSSTKVQPRPRCECGQVLKPNVVLFGDPIPSKAWSSAIQALDECDAVMVVGTSAQVAPFSDLPVLAARRGIPVVEINLESTSLTRLPTLLLRGPAGQLLPAFVQRLGADIHEGN